MKVCALKLFCVCAMLEKKITTNYFKNTVPLNKLTHTK